MRSLVLLLAAVAASPAFAQGLPVQGIGFAQAGSGAWLCRHENPEDALSCAREQCSEQAPGQDCAPAAWCYPARWSGMMTVRVGEASTTQILCGAPSEAALTAGLGALCIGSEAAESPAQCEMTLLVDPEGNERRVEGVSFGVEPEPAPGAPARPTAPAPEPATPDTPDTPAPGP